MPDNGRAFVGSLAARRLFLGITVLFGLAVLIQVFLAGEAALVAPETWQAHVAWVHLFQWLSVALPVTAYLARPRVAFAATNGVPMVLIGLQYALIHRAIAQAAPLLAGLHAVNGAILFGFVVFIARDWREP